MYYIIEDENNQDSFYFNNDHEEESENIIKVPDENAFQRDDNRGCYLHKGR